MPKISGLPFDVTPSGDDYIITLDTGSGTTKRVLLSDLLNANGLIGFAGLASTIFSGQIATGTNAGAGGGDTNYLNLGGLKICWGTTNSTAGIATNASATRDVTFPTTFASAPKVIGSVAFPTIDGRLGLYVVVVTTTTAQFSIQSMNAGASATGKVTWLAIGT